MPSNVAGTQRFTSAGDNSGITGEFGWTAECGCNDANVDAGMPDSNPGEQRLPPGEHCTCPVHPPSSAPALHAADETQNGSSPNRRKGGRNVPTLAEIRDQWPPTVDVPTAGSVFGLSRSHAYDLIKHGKFPAKVIQVGSRYRVLTESIVRALTGEPESTPPH